MDLITVRDYFREMIVELLAQDKDSPLIAFLQQCFISEVENSNIHILCKAELAKSYIERNCLHLIKGFMEDKLSSEVNILLSVDETLEIDDSLYNYSDEQFPTDTNSDENLAQENATNSNSTNDSSEVDTFDYYKYSKLNSSFTFDNFIRGTTNNYAVAASMNVAEHPGKDYNPLYIYGGVGLGKTHIIQSIGNHFIANNPTAKVLYVDGSTFRDEFIESIRSKRSSSFKNKYRSLDMLLLDDLQLLQTAQETSKELFDIFQALDNENKQMVFVSDKPPRELQNIEARLKNRFEKSLIILMEPPQFETRLAIIEKKLEGYNTQIDTTIVEHIASNITTDIRKIEGAIKSYLSIRDIMGITTLEECIEKNIFKDYITTSGSIKEMSVRSMIKAVAKYYGITDGEILGQNRSKHIVRIRHITMYIAATYSGKSTTEIGVEFKKDHASIIFARNKIMELIKTDSHISNEIASLLSSI